MPYAAKGHSFISPYQAGIDFSLIMEEHKKTSRGLFELRAKCGSPAAEGDEKKSSEIFA